MRVTYALKSDLTLGLLREHVSRYYVDACDDVMVYVPVRRTEVESLSPSLKSWKLH